jgi:hypothetical protein
MFAQAVIIPFPNSGLNVAIRESSTMRSMTSIMSIGCLMSGFINLKKSSTSYLGCDKRRGVNVRPNCLFADEVVKIQSRAFRTASSL